MLTENKNYYIYEDNELKKLEKQLYKQASGITPGNLFVLGVALLLALKISTPLLARLSESIGLLILSDASYMKLLKVNTVSEVLEKLEANYKKFLVSTTGSSGVASNSLLNVISTGISNKLNNKLGDILLLSVHVGLHANIAGYTLLYELLRRMILPQSQLSLTNYLISVGVGYGTLYARDKLERRLLDNFPNLFVAYKKFLQNLVYGTYGLINQLLVSLTGIGYYGYKTVESFGKLFIGNGFNDVKTYGIRFLGSLFSLNPKTISDLFVDSFKQSNKTSYSKYLVGLRAIADYKKLFEGQFGLSILENIKQTDEETYKQILLNLETRSKMRGTSTKKELNYLLFIHFLETSESTDPRILGFISELNNRSKTFVNKTSSLDSKLELAGVKRVTFRDILENKIKYSDIVQSNVGTKGVTGDINDTEFLNIVNLLIKHGLDEKLLIGHGFYTNGKNIVNILPRGAVFLELLSNFSNVFSIPYLGFNPLQMLQPELMLNYFYTRPVVLKHSSILYVPTKEGLKQVQDILKEILFPQYYQSILTMSNDYIVYSKLHIKYMLSKIDQLININPGNDISNSTLLSDLVDNIFQLVDELNGGLKSTENKETIKQIKLLRKELSTLSINFLPEQKETEQLVKQLSSNINRLVFAKQMFNELTDNVANNKNATSIRTLNSFLKMVGVEDYSLNNMYKSLTSIANNYNIDVDISELFNQTKHISKRLLNTLGNINNKLKDLSLLYIGDLIVVNIDNYLYDVTGYVGGAINIQKKLFTGSMIETYAKQTGTMYLTKEFHKTLRTGAKYNLPFYTDYNIGDNIFIETFNLLKTIFRYDDELRDMLIIMDNQKLIGQLYLVNRLFLFIEPDAYDAMLDSDSNIEAFTKILNLLLLFGKSSNQLKVFAELHKGDLDSPLLLELANLLKLNSIESKIYSELNLLLDSGIQITKEWLLQPITKSGITRGELLLKFGFYLTNLGGILDNFFKNSSIDVFFKQIDLMKDSLTNVDQLIVNKIADLKNDITELLNPFIELRKNNYVNNVINTVKKHTSDFIDDSTFEDSSAKLLISLLLYKSGLSKLLELHKNVRNIDLNVLYDFIDKYNVKNVVDEIVSDKALYDVEDYERILRTTFGESIIENKLKTRFQKGASIYDVHEVGLENITQYVVDKETFLLSKISDKYDLLVSNNQYIVLGNINTDNGIKGFFRSVFPNVYENKSDVENVNLLSLLSQLYIGKPLSYLELLGLGKPNPQTTYNLITEFGLLLQKVSWLLAGYLLFKTVDLFTSLFGVNLDKTILEISTSLVVGAVSIANVLGLHDASQYLHDHFPGLTLTIGGALGLLTGSTQNMFMFLGLGTMLEYIPSTRETVLQVEGVKNVPIYRLQGWEYGREPYWGGTTSDYIPSRLYMWRKQLAYTPLMFGSKIEELAFGTGIPNPFNLFGILPYFTQDYYTNKLLLYRPYMYSGQPSGAFTPLLNIPSILNHPLQYTALFFAGFLSKLIYPNMDISQQYFDLMLQNGLYINDDALSIYAISKYAKLSELLIALGVGFSDEYVLNMHLQLSNKTELILSEYIGGLEKSRYSIADLEDYMLQYTGFFGFVTSLFISPFGDSSSFRTLKVQTLDYWKTEERRYFQQQIGNVFGITEYFRRIVQNERRKDLTINPMPNLYMQHNFPWLPEKYQFGDLYLSKTYGEFRLPGIGYEYIRGSVDDYGLVDIYRILSNILPNSSITDKLEEYILKYQKQEGTDETIRYIIQQLYEERKNVQSGMHTSEYKQNMKLIEKQYEVDKYIGEGRFLSKDGNVIEIRGVQFDIDLLAKQIFESRNVSISEAYSVAKQELAKYELQLKNLEGQRVTLLVPEDAGIRIKYYGENDFRVQAILPTLKYEQFLQRNETDVDYRLNNQPGILEKLWENILHRYGYFNEKFIPVRSLYEEFSRYYYHGLYQALWDKPLSILYEGALNTLLLKPIDLLVHASFVGSMFGTNIGYSSLFGTVSGTLLLLGSIVTTQDMLESDTWQDIRNIEKQVLTIKHLQGTNSFDKLNQLESLKELKYSVPIEEQYVFSKLVDLSLNDYRDIIAKTPLYYKLILTEIYENKIRALQGLATDPYIDEGYHQEYEQEVYNKLLEQMNPLAARYLSNIDVELYRTLLAMRNTKNLSIMGVLQEGMLLYQRGLYNSIGKASNMFIQQLKDYIDSVLLARIMYSDSLMLER